MANALYSFLKLFGFEHPLHPVLVHMVIGPVIAALLFYLIAWIFKKPALYSTARQLNVFALIAWFPTVTMGVLDWLHFYGGANIPEIMYKSIGAGVLLIILVTNVVLFKKIDKGSKIHLVLYLAAGLTVAFIGLMGGNLVYGSKPASVAATPITKAAVVANDTKQVTVDGFTLTWQVQGPNVHMSVAYKTTGWVGVGFGKQPLMNGAHIIIGYVNHGKAVVQDDVGEGHYHAPENQFGGKNDLTDVSGSLVNGVTKLEWTMPLNTGNPKDIVLVPGQPVSVIFAHGGMDAKNLTSYHGPRNRTSTRITF